MIVIIDDALFDPAASVYVLDLMTLFRMGLAERHYLVLEPPFDPEAEPEAGRAVNRWLDQQGQTLREEVSLALENGLIAEASGPSPRPRLRIRVANVKEPDWGTDPPVLPLATACQLLAMPLCLLVEDSRTESSFLRAFSPPTLRERLERAVRDGWVEFEHGGGLPGMLPRVREKGQDHLRALRLWVMFDSDARSPFDPDSPHPVYGPSKKSRAVADACQRARGNLQWHQLRRRAIENYVPGRVLQAWAGHDRARNHKVEVFLGGMDRTQRHYFNMKDGFAGDRKDKHRGIAPIYDDTLQASQHLQTGFSDLADFLHERQFRIEPSWMTDHQMDELGPLIESIFARM